MPAGLVAFGVALIIAIPLVMYKFQVDKDEAIKILTDMYKNELNKAKHEMKTINGNIDKLQVEIDEQESKLNNNEFKVPRHNKNIKIILNIGPTGFGKSLVCNRLIGNDDSINDIIEESAVFKVAEEGDPDSETKEFEMTQKSDICIVDAPGQFDSHGNDTDIYNFMAKYFKGCGGVNLFCIYYKFGGKLDINYKNLLKSYQKFWGPDMWEYCCVIITFVDNPTKQLNSINKIKSKYIEFLNEISNNKCNNIMFYEFGKENFKQSRNKIFKRLSKSTKKYVCDSVSAPVNELIDKLHILKEKKQKIQNTINTCKGMIPKLQASKEVKKNK